MKVAVAGICFLRRGSRNVIRRMSAIEAATCIISQTIHRLSDVTDMNLLLGHVDDLVRKIPVYELTCLPNEEAARLSYETMRRGAEEIGL